jgi:hypothetical protein
MVTWSWRPASCLRFLCSLAAKPQSKGSTHSHSAQRGTANNALFINKSDNAVATSQRSYGLQWVADADPAGPGQRVRFIVFLDNGLLGVGS